VISIVAGVIPVLGRFPAAALSRAEDYDAELAQQNGWTSGHNDWSAGSLRVPPPGLAQAAIDATNKRTITL